jgi:hypothetical protein
MHLAERALAWQVWWRHRWGLAVVGAIFAVVVVLFQVAPSGSDDKTKHAYFASFQFVFALIYVATVFGYGFESALESRESGFPARLFTLPVRTTVLVGWPMLQGMFVVGLIWAAWTQLVLRSSNIDASPLTEALHAAAFVAVLQALLWWPFGLPWARVITALFCLPLLALTPIFARLFDVDEIWLRSLYVAFVPCAYALAVVGVARARRGDSPQWNWLPARTARAARRLKRSQRFGSPAQAQLWFERRNVFSLVVTVACFGALMLAMILWIDDSPENKVKLGFNFLLIPLFAAAIAGISIGRLGTAKNPYLLPAFTGTRPVTTVSLVVAKLKSAALGTAVAWAVMVPIAAIWFFDAGLHEKVPMWWRAAVDAGRADRLIASVIVVAALLFLLTWRLMIDNLCVSLTGRTWLFKASLVLHGVALTAFAMTYARYTDNPRAFRPLLDAMPWILGCLVGLKLLLSGWAVRMLILRGLLDRQLALRLLGVWLLLAGGSFAVVQWLAPNGIISTASLAFGVALLLPMARLAAAPLALDWNRHR